MSKIRQELVDAAGIKQKDGESENAFLVRLVAHISDSDKFSGEKWDGLSEKAQDWNNNAADAISDKKDLPPFPDAEKEEAAPSRRGRRGAAAEEEKKEAYKPKVGDAVVYTSKRGKTIEGIIVELDEEQVVLNPKGEKGDEKDDSEWPLAGATIAPAGSKQAAAAEEEEPAAPKVGDTVRVETHRGKIIIGKITELSDEEMVLVDSTDAEHEFVREKLKDVKVQVRGKSADKEEKEESSGRRGRSAEKEEDKPSGRRGRSSGDDKSKEGSGRASNADKEVSVGVRVGEIMLDNPGIKVEEVNKVLKKEGYEFRENTLDLNYKSASKFLELLKTRKLWPK